MQILYSQYAANSKPKELLKILEEISLKFYLFFITYLLLFRDLKREFTEKEKIVSNKNFNNDSKLDDIKNYCSKTSIRNFSEPFPCPDLRIKFLYGNFA